MLKIQVGEVVIQCDGPITSRQLHALLGKAATVALMLNAADTPEDEETKPPVSLGFTTEIADPIEVDLSEYFEE